MATNPVFPDVAPWPDQAAPAPMGHNKPPLAELIPVEFPLAELIPVEFRTALLAERPEFLTRFEALIAASDRAMADDDESLGRCGDLVDAYRKAEKHINETHKTVKEPYLLGGRLVDAEKNVLIEPLAAAKRKVEAIGNAFVAKREAEQLAERRRLEAEQRAAAERAAEAERARVRAEQEAARAVAEANTQAEREAAIDAAAAAREESEQAMAEAALAPAAPAKSEPVRSDAGSTVSAKQEWKCQVDDYAKAMRAVKSDPKVKEAIEAAVARLVRAGQREIPGCTIWPVAKANFR